MKIWQVATGEPGRDYREIFFNHDVMILGPSHKGSAKENNYGDGIPNSAGSQVVNFCKGPKSGDRVLMRFGKEVIGVGQIPISGDTYSFNKSFACVYGWDLCHTQRVKWARDLDLTALSTVYQAAKQKPSFTRVHEPHILNLTRNIPNDKFDEPLKPLPNNNSKIYSHEELGVELFRAGVSNKNIEDILKALQQAERLCSWYWSKSSGRKPSEFEIVAHIIVPLFLGLGWSHQQIAVEWNNVDVAFFKQTPTSNKNCVIVLEAKGLGQPLSDVLRQPLKYVKDLGLNNARIIITTDGANIFVYQKRGDTWEQTPCGYVNVTTLQKEYVLPQNIDLVKTLVSLQPSMV